MTKQFDEPFLNRPIAELGFSPAFCAVTEQLGYFTPADLLQVSTGYLRKLPGFSASMLVEYVGFLERRGVGDYLDGF